MKKNSEAGLADLIKEAESNGWTYLGNNTVRRMAEPIHLSEIHDH